jgi:heterokaryon incompatibility protein (HET)
MKRKRSYNDSCLKRNHRDLSFWSNDNVQYCLSCSTPLIDPSELYDSLHFRDQIRLLKLHPGTSSSRLSCELVHVRLQDNPYYEAVSYTWADEDGNLEFRCPLLIREDCRPIMVSTSCAAVLKRFRDETVERILWIDAVCIDQKNTLERSEQVEIMPRIYRQAKEVLVYIGDVDEGDFDTYIKPLRRLAISEETNADILQLRDFWINLTRRGWFHRIWVLQEVILAQKATFHLGCCAISWENLVKLHYLVSNKSKVKRPVIFELYEVLQKQKNDSKVCLEEILQITSQYQAARPRDKIYALLGFVDERVREFIRPVLHALEIGFRRVSRHYHCLHQDE